MGKSVVTRQASERELGHDYPSQVRQNQLQLAAEARQQVVSIDLLSLEEETRERSEREEHLLKISLPCGRLPFWQESSPFGSLTQRHLPKVVR